MSDVNLKYCAKGSILLVCLVFLAALSITALSAVEVSLMGQKMIFAYIRHNTAFIDMENQLIETEQHVWRQLESTGLASTALVWSGEHDATSTGRFVAVFSSQWVQTEFSIVQCGVLFSVSFHGLSHESVSTLQPVVDWWVCCETSQLCEQAKFLSTRRDWRPDSDL